MKYQKAWHIDIKFTDLVTAYILINKVTAHMNWFFLRCMHINRESILVTLSEKMNPFQLHTFIIRLESNRTYKKKEIWTNISSFDIYYRILTSHHLTPKLHNDNVCMAEPHRNPSWLNQLCKRHLKPVVYIVYAIWTTEITKKALLV